MGVPVRAVVSQEPRASKRQHLEDQARERKDVGARIDIDPTSGLVTVELTAHAWGDARQTLRSLRLDGELLLGDGGSIGNQTPGALYSLSFALDTIPG